MCSRPALAAIVATVAPIMAVLPLHAQDVCLEYVSRYSGLENDAKHLVGVESVFGHYALMTSANRIDVIDLETLTPDDDLIAPLSSAGLQDVYSTVTRADGWGFINLRLRGFAVMHLDEQSLQLTLHGEVNEPGVYYDNMTVVGDRLYVPAHAYGIRIFDITNPAAPVLIGSADEGFDDAFHIAVDGSTAYVADGAGGIKIVDLSDETQPVVVDGEDPATALGTSEHVLVRDGHVYVACGGAGVAVYETGQIADPLVYDTPICAKALAVVGDFLAAADIGGLEVFAIQADGSLTPVARERSARRYWDGAADSLRLWHGVSAWGGDRVLAANWDYVDVFELVDPADASQPDATASSQRLRFPPTGATQTVQVFNGGCAPLVIDQISCTAASFTVAPASATVPPGESLELSVSYAGEQPGEALVLVESNDPDESPLPIQVYGDTQYLDPGETAIGFTAESWTYDHESETYVLDVFDLDEHAGKFVYFHVFAPG